MVRHQNEVGCGNVKDGRQRSADVVERNSDVLQAQVVERDYGDEDEGEGQDLKLNKLKKI